MVQKWNIGEKDKVKIWNAPKLPSFWVFVHAQHLQGVIIVRKPNVGSSLRLGHENGRSELWVGLKGLTWEKNLWSREWWWDRRFCECLKRSNVFLLTPRGWVFFVNIERSCALEGGCVLEWISKVFNITHWKEVGEWMSIVKALMLHQMSIGWCQLWRHWRFKC